MSEKEKKYSSLDILNGVANHDREVLEFIYKSYFDVVKKFVLINSGDEQDAWDVFQDAIGVIYDKASDPGFMITSTFQTFFITVCKFIWYKKLRRKKFEKTVIYSENFSFNTLNQEEVNDKYRENTMFRLYRKYFSKLKSDCQKILLMTSEGEKTNHIAAQIQFHSTQAVYNKRRRCLKKLMSWIESDPEYENLNENEKP